MKTKSFDLFETWWEIVMVPIILAAFFLVLGILFGREAKEFLLLMVSGGMFLGVIANLFIVAKTKMRWHLVIPLLTLILFLSFFDPCDFTSQDLQEITFIWFFVSLVLGAFIESIVYNRNKNKEE